MNSNSKASLAMTDRTPEYPSIDEMLAEEKFAGTLGVDHVERIQKLYLLDDKPWVIGFSGGKDSTTVLSLVYSALEKLPKEKLRKHVYVVSSDTLVETPLVVNMITSTIDKVNQSAKERGLPISAHQVFPKEEDTFWVNLLGKGYPAPTRNFRWCTERMKIDPVSTFILDKVAKFGEVIVVLGARSDESASRAQVINKHKIEGSPFSRHSSLPGAFTLMPIEDWDFDEVWMYLLGAECPWGGDNFELFDLYKGSSAGECPLVIDTKTPSCGNSRFGCWTCTVVTQDRAMEGLIEAGEVWMQELKDFRDMLYMTTLPENKAKFRNHKRRTGQVTFSDSSGEEKLILGPYWLEYRKEWLRKLLTIQENLRLAGRDMKLIHESELHNIRKEWLNDPNEPDWEDSLPEIYREVTGSELQWNREKQNLFDAEDVALIRSLSAEKDIPHALTLKLLELELSVDGLSKRQGFTRKLEQVLDQDWGSLQDIQNTRELAKADSTIADDLKELEKEYESI